MSKQAGKKKKSSLDYPLLARKLIEASGDDAVSKLPAALYVVATPIGHRGDISLRALMTLSQADVVACEDTRTSGMLLSKYGLDKKLIAYHDHSDDKRVAEIVTRIAGGEAVALISDAGLPLISDPGYQLIRACQQASVGICVIPGANAALTGLMGSGLPTHEFHFAGFLPNKSAARQKAIAELKAIPGTLIFYEAPQRLAESLHDLALVLGGARPVAVARELTKLYEETRRGTLNQLVEYYDSNDVKGEIVILVGPKTDEATEEYDLDALLKTALKSQTMRDAVSAVSDMTGVKKSEVYTRALKLSETK